MDLVFTAREFAFSSGVFNKIFSGFHFLFVMLIFHIDMVSGLRAVMLRLSVVVWAGGIADKIQKMINFLPGYFLLATGYKRA